MRHQGVDYIRRIFWSVQDEIDDSGRETGFNEQLRNEVVSSWTQLRSLVGRGPLVSRLMLRA